MSCDDILRARRHGLTDKPASPPRNEEILPTFIAIQYEYDKRQTSVLCGVWCVVCGAETRLGHHTFTYTCYTTTTYIVCMTSTYSMCHYVIVKYVVRRPKFQSPLLVTCSVVGVFGALLGRCCVAVHGGGDALLLVCRRAYDSQSASEHR